jgi:hypothetical protein
MMESMSLFKIATYRPEKSEDIVNLSPNNFFYDANHAGGTTINRLIEKSAFSADSRIIWLRNSQISAMESGMNSLPLTSLTG